MSACTDCGAKTSAGWRYCASCGAAQGGAVKAVTAAARAPETARIHLDDVLYNCQRCGKEARYAELPRCTVCKEPMCGDCVVGCSECKRLACRDDLVECATCKKVGCAHCFDRCETCGVSGLCPDHAVGCGDCGYPTCETCFGTCKKCGLEVCAHCLEGHKAEKR